MRIPRFGIGDLMVIAAVAAADVAAVRAVINRNEYFGPALHWIEATMPIAIVLQCSVFWLRIDRRRSRVLWIAFLIAGIAGLGSVVWHLSDPPTETTTFSTSGTSTQIYSGGPASRLWGPYLEAAYTALNQLGLTGTDSSHWTSDVTDELVFLLPQLLLALAIGLLAQAIGKRFVSCPAPLEATSPVDTPPPDGRLNSPSSAAGWPRSIWLASIGPAVRHVAAIVAVLLIAMIASGMPGWVRTWDERRKPFDERLLDLKLPPIVDDLKFLAPPPSSALPR
jgi:hypothetical protein